MDKKQTRTVIAALASPIALIATGALVYQASFAAFTATAPNDGNSWQATNAITLTTDKSTALFASITGVVPGYTSTKCILVTPNSGPASSVRMYAKAPGTANSGTFQNHLTLKVESLPTAPADATDGACAAVANGAAVVPEASISSLISTRAAWADAASGAWTVAATSTTPQYYRVTAAFSPTVSETLTQAQLDAMQGQSAGIGLVWERRTS